MLLNKCIRNSQYVLNHEIHLHFNSNDKYDVKLECRTAQMGHMRESDKGECFKGLCSQCAY